MAKGQCICSYRAMTRCELFQLGVDDLYKVIQQHMVEERQAEGRDTAGGKPTDEMAEIIYAEFSRRHLLRALSLRMMLMKRSGSGGVSGGGDERPQGRFSGSANERQEAAALRIQAIWVHRAAKAMLRGEDDRRSISSLVPGLYYAVRSRGAGRSGRRRSPHGPSAGGHLPVPQVGDSSHVLDDGSTARSVGSEQEAAALLLKREPSMRRSEQLTAQPSSGGGGAGGVGVGGGMGGVEFQVHLERMLKAHEARLELTIKAAVQEAVAKAVAGLQQTQKV